MVILLLQTHSEFFGF